MTKEKLDLQHKELLSKRLREINVRLSEFSFANLYLFRENHNYHVVVDGDCVNITGNTNDGVEFVLPLCDSKNPDPIQLIDMADRFGMIYPVSDCWMKYFDPKIFTITHNEDDSDYIYTVEKMSTYSGRHLSKKRNLLKQFFANHTAHREELTVENSNLAIEVLDKWQDEMKSSNGSTDYKEALEALKLIDKLSLNGYIYIIDGKPGAYVLGEKITNDTYALHFAKGLTSFKGVYQFIFNDLAKALHQGFTYMNFEQDLGLQPLRQAKSSYKPDHMGMKYRVTLKPTHSQ